MTDRRFDVPIMPAIKNPLVAKERLNPAEWTYKRLVSQITEFEAKLSSHEEIGGRFVTAPHMGTIHIIDIGYWNPDMLIFHAEDADGKPMQLIQHHSQLSLLLIALPKTRDEPRRIGFVLEAKLRD